MQLAGTAAFGRRPRERAAAPQRPAHAPAHLAGVQAGAGQHGGVGGGGERQQALGVGQRLDGVQQAQVGKVVDQDLLQIKRRSKQSELN